MPTARRWAPQDRALLLALSESAVITMSTLFGASIGIAVAAEGTLIYAGVTAFAFLATVALRFYVMLHAVVQSDEPLGVPPRPRQHLPQRGRSSRSRTRTLPHIAGHPPRRQVRLPR